MSAIEKLKNLTLDELFIELETYYKDKEYWAFIREEIRARLKNKFKN